MSNEIENEREKELQKQFVRVELIPIHKKWAQQK